jgi:uncharacterized protein YdcH (DUF465 family)
MEAVTIGSTWSFTFQLFQTGGEMNQFSTTEALKEYLYNSDQRFRELASEHRRYEERLTQRAALAYPNEDELVEEKSLKKRKLFLKDQMEAILQQYRHADQ